jgi:hypothetical protein
MLLAVTLGPAPTALADPLPVEAGVWLDPASPAEGDRVSGTRAVSGTAQLPEGITSVELYVVATGSTDETPPVTSLPMSPLGVGLVEFRFDWDTARAPARVDLRVVATGLLRSVEVVVPHVVVERAAVAPRAAAHRPVTRSAARVAGAVRPVAPGRVSVRVDRSGVYLGGFGELAYPPSARAAVTTVPAARHSLTEPGGGSTPTGPWTSVAAGLLLILTAAHVHRALRVPPVAPPLEGSS